MRKRHGPSDPGTSRIPARFIETPASTHLCSCITRVIVEYPREIAKTISSSNRGDTFSNLLPPSSVSEDINLNDRTNHKDCSFYIQLSNKIFAEISQDG